MHLKELYKKDTGSEWDCVGYPTVAYVEWLEASFNNADFADVRQAFISDDEIDSLADVYSTQEGKYRVASYEAFRDGANTIARYYKAMKPKE